jgi:hypothetical protein
MWPFHEFSNNLKSRTSTGSRSPYGIITTPPASSSGNSPRIGRSPRPISRSPRAITPKTPEGNLLMPDGMNQGLIKRYGYNNIECQIIFTQIFENLYNDLEFKKQLSNRDHGS